MGNFSFLQDKFPPLAHLGAMAERYCYNDPNSSLMKIGMLGESIVNLIYWYDDVPFPTENKADRRINRLLEQEYITRDIADALHIVRRARNKAVHENYDSADASLRLLPVIFGICAWFMEVYGDYNYKAQPYVKPAKPSEGAPKETAAAKKQDEEIAAKAVETSADVKKLTPEERRKKAQSAARKRDITEAETRALIDEQLRRVGWQVDTVEVRYGKGARPKKGVNQAIAEWPTESGPVDYALFIGEELVGIIEAKRWGKDVSAVLDSQGSRYAQNIRKEDETYLTGEWGKSRIPFLFAANGRPYIKQYEEASGIWFLDCRKPENIPHALRGWMSPEGIQSALGRQTEEAEEELEKTPYDDLTDPDGLNLRYYQVEAIQAAEAAVARGQKGILLAMATGTGKTRTVLGLIYRFLKTNRFRRILFLVDRTVLGDQAMSTFSQVRLEQMLPLASIYNIQSLGDDADLQRETRVQIATVQSMVRRILYHESDTMPAITDFDLVIIDEAHRGYILDKEKTDEQELYRDDLDFVSKYRSVMEYFDAVKIALTATPALHTTQIFGAPVYTYSYRDAVIDGYLVDHNVPLVIRTELGEKGIHYKKGTSVNVYDTADRTEVKPYEIPDDLDFDVDDFNKAVIAEGFNKAVAEFISARIDPEDRTAGKTLIYAVNDRHADMIVNMLKDCYSKQGVPNEAVMKITGSVENGNPKKIREAILRFKNEQYPSMVATVDLLTTGVDVPAITNLVFLRRVKSRILFEQMLGRATRLCPEIHKEKFDIYDAVGTYEALEPFNTMKPVVTRPQETFATLLDGLTEGTQTEAAVNEKITAVIAKLRRKQKNIYPEDEDLFAAGTNTKNIGDFIAKLRTETPAAAKQRILDAESELTALDKTHGYHAPVIIDKTADHVTETQAAYGKNETPEDYLKAFSEWIETHENDVAALHIVLTSPADLTRADLIRLRRMLGQDDRFTETKLNKAVSATTRKEVAADIISLIRRAAIGSPLLSRKERMDRAIERVLADLAEHGTVSKKQENFLKKIGTYFTADENYIVSKEMFREDSRWKKEGGYNRFNKLFDSKLDNVLEKLNEYLYDDGGESA